jgi:hypothetical protein
LLDLAALFKPNSVSKGCIVLQGSIIVISKGGPSLGSGLFDKEYAKLDNNQAHKIKMN